MRPTQSQIGSWLAELREKADKTQRQAAEAVDTDAGTVSRWELGKMPMSAERFFALAVFYSVKRIDLADITGRDAGAGGNGSEPPFHPMPGISPPTGGTGRERKGGAKGK